MTKRGMPPIHPGEFLAEILDELEMAQAELQGVTDRSPTRDVLLFRSKPI